MRIRSTFEELRELLHVLFAGTDKDRVLVNDFLNMNGRVFSYDYNAAREILNARKFLL